MTLARAASAAARPYQPEKRHRLWHTLQIMTAALLGDEETSDLALHLRRHYDRARFCQRLNTGCSVGRIPVNLARGIDHHRTGFDTYARVERWLPRTGVLAVDISE